MRKLPNLNSNQVEISKEVFNNSFVDLLNDPEPYEINNVLSRADNEVDIYLRQLDNKKKNLFSSTKTYKSS